MWSDMAAIKGKTIKNIVVSSSLHQQDQVFLVFDDGYYMEIYGERMKCANGLSSGGVEAAEQYAKNCGDNRPKVI